MITNGQSSVAPNVFSRLAVGYQTTAYYCLTSGLFPKILRTFVQYGKKTVNLLFVLKSCPFQPAHSMISTSIFYLKQTHGITKRELQ